MIGRIRRRMVFESLETRKLLTADVSPMFTLADGAEIEDATSNLTRNGNSLDVSVDTSHLDPAAYTLWWVVFNHPEFCSGPCDEADLFDPAVQAAAMYADGMVVEDDGIGHFMAHLEEGVTDGVPEELTGLPGADYGLMDARKAEVQLVIHSHGSASDDPDVRHEQISTFNSGCNPECFDVQAAVHAPPDAAVSTSAVFTLADGAEIADASSKLTRDDDSVAVRVDTSHLDPAAYTLWWVVFNHPEFCSGPCDGADLFDPAVQAAAMYADGMVVEDDGIGHFMAHLEEGVTDGVPEELAGLPGADHGLMDARKAEVQLVIHSHGTASDDPDVRHEQISTFNGGCNPECFDVQAAVHAPPHPILLGDSSGDGTFDRQDVLQVLQAGKYQTGQPAAFSEGDWNADGVFDQFDIIAALKTGRYVANSNAASAEEIVDAILADESMLR